MTTVDFQPESTMVYIGQSDLIAQVIYELKNHPDSCMAKNLLSWYNALYSASTNDLTCSYQVQTKAISISDLPVVLKSFSLQTIEVTLENYLSSELTRLIPIMTKKSHEDLIKRLKDSIK
jgi:hypothetical protein